MDEQHDPTPAESAPEASPAATPEEAAAVDAPAAVSAVADTSSEAAPTATAEVAEPAEPEAPTFRYQSGDILPGTITLVGPNGIEADLGDGVLAVIPRAELDGEPTVGQQVEGTVIKHQANTGRYVISPRRAARTRAWARIVEAFETGTPITGTVTDTTKGGLIVDLGLRAFLPESLIDVRKPQNPRALVGQQVTVVVIEAEKLTGAAAASERRSEKVVVNRRAVMETERRAAKERLVHELVPGQRLRGRVSALTDFGAFVDLGGAEGLVHVSELAHRPVAKPGDVVKVGDELDVVVLEVRADRGKISLSRKAALPNPWEAFQQHHQVGDLVFGTVSGIAAFGVFVTVTGEGFEPVEGLVHISELSRFRVETPAEVVAVGEGVWTKVLTIEPDRKRLSLSLRRALED